MRARIHRGAHEIGGSCVEVAADDGERIVLDLGRPLSAGWDDEVVLPPVPGLRPGEEALLGLLVSHPHLDHYGLATSLDVGVPIYLGREASRVLEAAAFFSPVSASLDCAGYLEDRVPFQLGPFTVTPYLADHSAFDSYSLLIEADRQRLFYTGDLRAHGRKAALFERLLREPPRSIDSLLMEGTHVRADPAHDEAEFETESQLESRFVELCRETAGAVVVFGSAQNLDRLVTVFRASRRSGRTCVIDLYTASVAAATRDSIPQPGFDGLQVYVPERQRVLVKRSAEFDRVQRIRSQRIFRDAMAADPGSYVVCVPSSSVRELLRDEVLTPDGVAVWSLWKGYLDEPSGRRLMNDLAEAGVGMQHLHTSGHASVPDLRRLVAALSPGQVVPIHSEAGDRYEQLFAGVTRRADGAWWDVASPSGRDCSPGECEGDAST